MKCHIIAAIESQKVISANKRFISEKLIDVNHGINLNQHSKPQNKCKYCTVDLH
jgi:hypothetical protein